MKKFSVIVLLALAFSIVRASDIIEVLPLTNNIIMVHFDDGSITYPDALSVSRLNTANAVNTASYSITSADDANYSSATAPVTVARKTKGTTFQKNSGGNWVGDSFDPTGKPWAAEHWLYLTLPTALETGKSYTLSTGSLAANNNTWNFTYDEKLLRSEAVHINTIGYAADAPKYGYIYHWMGSGGGLNLSGFAGNSFWIYKDGNPVAVKTGTIAFRKSATNAETGQANDTKDRNFLGGEVYEADFSDVTADGTYTLVIEGIGCSYPFKIGTDALWEAYYTVARALYYQRSGIRLAPPFTDGSYVRPVNQNTKVTSDDGTSFAGKLLYSDYPMTSWADGNSGGSTSAAIRDAAIGKPLDVAGWYHDAGDWDGYFSHQRIPILLMLTYEAAAERFADGDLNLPESGNGIPDILDEASWLIKFNYRLRKELMAKGYSDGGVGGARVCADVFTEVDGNAESNLPSWKENRRTVVTQADAFMTYLYAGQAAQFGYILKTIGKNPASFPVEMLDAVDFASMTKDNVNWIAESEAAYAWASAPENQPANNNNFSDDISVYKMYAAVNLFRLTGKTTYHDAAKTELNKYKSSALGEDQRYGVYSYLFCDNFNTDQTLKSALQTAVVNTANARCMNAINNRACRWGGIFDFPMLVGQGTTPWVFETIIAYKATGEAQYRNAVHTTADYFLGTNPLHSTWATGLGPRPAQGGFHLDSRYNNNWVTYPGFIPYGPWSMAFSGGMKTWEIDGVSITGGGGSWHEQWHNFSLVPHTNEWPGHERWCANIHSPMSAENTIHQNTVYGFLTYGFINNRHNTNASASVPVTSIDIDSSDFEFQYVNQAAQLTATLAPTNASFPALLWSSSNTAVAWVDQYGKVTAVGNGTAVITCSTLDGSVSDQITITNNSLTSQPVEEVKVTPESIELTEGKSTTLTVEILPENATNKAYFWSSADSTVAYVENDEVLALVAGSTWVYAISEDNGVKDSAFIEVLPANYTIIADFDVVIPNDEEVKPDSSHIFAPEGTMDIAAANPLQNSLNPSELVFKWGRPSGDWRLFGFDLPSENMPNLARYEQFQFKYYGSQIQTFYIKLIYEDDTFVEIFENAAATDNWSLFAYDLNSNKRLKVILIFVNQTGASPAFEAYFDDFRLLEFPAGEEVCTTKPLLDFETIELNWSAGYGGWGWASGTFGKADNPSVDASNGSAKVARWVKDNTNAWGGFTIVMPANSTAGYTSLEYQVYSTAQVNASRNEIKMVDDLLGGYTLNNTNIAPDTWTTITIPLEPMNLTADSFDRIQFQIGGGQAENMDIYIDNVRLKVCTVFATGVEIAQGNQTLDVGETVQLTATVLPENATNSTITWSSSDEDIATVSASGLVTAIAEGVATITVTSEDGGYTDAITVTVNEEVSSTVDGILQPFRMFPNPATNQLTIEAHGLAAGEASVEIADLSGRLVHSGVYNVANRSLKATINLSGVHASVYVVKVKTDTFTQTQRLIVK